MSEMQLKELIENQARIVPLTVDQYHQMIDAGILPEGQHIELIDGFLVRKDRSKAGEDPMTIGHEHAWVIAKITDLAAAVLRFGSTLRIQLPITLDTDGEPEPDAAIVRGPTDRYRENHPGAADIICVIEVADSSLRYDRNTKKRIYADGGIARYLIVNLVDRVIEDYTNPRRGTGSYANSKTWRKSESITIDLVGGTLSILVDELVP